MSSFGESIVLDYLENVRSIIGEFDEELYDYGRRYLVNIIEKVRVSTISAIIVGLTFDIFPKRKGQLFISTGQHPRECCMQKAMLDDLKKIQQADEKVLFLRTPFFAGGTENQWGDLIEAYHPFLSYILSTVTRNTNKNLPLLLLGHNAAFHTLECLKIKSRPRFIILQAVHPTFMCEIDEMIEVTTNRRKIHHFEDIKDYELKVFEQCLEILKLFVNIKLSSGSYNLKE